MPAVRRRALALLVAWVPTSSFCAGFSLTEYSVKRMGSAYAGATAAADEPATLYWNPAGLTQLEGTQIAGGVVFADNSARFNNNGSTQAFFSPAAGGFVTQPSRGSNGGDAGGPAWIPSAYLTHALTPQWTVGIGVFSPFGLKSKYDENWVGRYHAIKSSLKTVNINPSVAYRFNSQWSVGAGISAQYADVTLNQAVFTGGPDGKAELKGDDWTFGFNAGVLYIPRPGTQIGIAFRSQTDHQIRGHQTISNTQTPFDGRVDAGADLTLPASLALGFTHQLTPLLRIMADATWTGWNSFDEIRVKTDAGPDVVTPENWNNNWRFSAGASYRVQPAWTLRAGVMLDQTPIPDSEARTPRIPGDQRYWGAIGATYRASPQLSIDVAYTHIFFDDADLTQTADLAPAAPGLFTDTLVGDYSTKSNVLGLGLRYRF